MSGVTDFGKGLGEILSSVDFFDFGFLYEVSVAFYSEARVLGGPRKSWEVLGRPRKS